MQIMCCFSLGYSVAVGEFTGDSEQGEKANKNIVGQDIKAPKLSLTNHQPT